MNFAGGGRLDRFAKFLGLGIFQEVADSAGFYRLDYGTVFEDAGQGDQFDIGVLRFGFFNSFNAK